MMKDIRNAWTKLQKKVEDNIGWILVFVVGLVVCFTFSVKIIFVYSLFVIWVYRNHAHKKRWKLILGNR